MKISLQVEDASREDVEVKWSTDIFSFQRTPFECGQPHLKRQKRLDCFTISRILVSKRVKFMWFVIQAYFCSTELSVKGNEVACVDRLSYEGQLLREVL